MKFLKSLFRFYINSSIHVALAVVALSVLTLLDYKISLNLDLLSFVFFGTVTGYNFVKYAPVAKLHHRSLTNQLKQIQFFSFLCFIGLGVSVFFMTYEVLYICCVLGILILLYAIPIYKKNLRETALLKVFIIAVIWTSVSFVLPFIQENNFKVYQNQMWWIACVERFTWVVLLMIPFEIRDLRFDKAHIKTLVSVFGVLNVKIISILVLVAWSAHKVVNSNYQNLVFYLIVYLTLGLFILMSKKVQKPYFASFWVEALPIFWVMIWYLVYL